MTYFRIYNNIEPLIEPVYNFKYNYIRINGGDFNSRTLFLNFFDTRFSKEENKNKLFKYFSRFLHYQHNYGIPIKFDGAMEADHLYNNLVECGNNAEIILDWIIEWKELNNLSKDSIIFLTSDIHCKKNTPQKYVELVEPFYKMRFWCSPCLDFKKLNEREFEKKFYFPIARQNEWRTKLHLFFKNNDILKNSFWSINGRGLENNYENFAEPIKETHLIERYYDDWSQFLEWESKYIGHRLIKKSFCNIVMETFFANKKMDNGEIVFPKERFFTEKTFRPLTSCQPFILCSNSGNLKILKSFGFKTFDKWWDESYDDIEDDEERMKSIMEVISYINSLSIESLKKIYDEMIPTLIHNFELCKNIDLIHKEFQNNVHYTISEGYEYPLEYYDIQEGNEEGRNWNIVY